MEVFFRVDSVPTNSCILLDSPEAARGWPRGRIALAFCSACGFVLNVAFDPKLTEYSARYEETQGFSPTFQDFHRGLAEGLVARHNLHGKRVVEIGCGKGEFLHLLCSLGDNRGLGFDPSYIESRDQAVRGDDVEFVADYFAGQYQVDEADFVACKMTLEHIPETGQFVRTIRESVQGGPDSVVFIQVPEARRILEHCAFEDIYYEHCSYFTPGSLAALMQRSGFHVLGTEVAYDSQYLTVEAKFNGASVSPAARSSEELSELTSLVSSFTARAEKKITGWREDMLARTRDGQTVVVWGSGSKGVSFLTTLGIGDAIEHVVDINPHRQGYFMPGTGQRIVGPDDLVAVKPDCVVVMNAIYADEIGGMLGERGLEPDIVAL